MKIKYIVNARIPTEKAHGYQIFKMCNEFALTGVDVELIVPTRMNPITKDAFSYYKIKKNFKLTYIKSYDFLKFVKIFGRFSFYAQSIYFVLKLFFAKIDKDAIIYTRNPEIVWLFSLRNYKTAYECHDWFKKSKNIALFLLKKLNFLIVTNSFIAKEFKKNAYKRDILIAPNGIDLKIFDVDIPKAEALNKVSQKEFAKLAKGKKVLLYTGSFRTMGQSKGIDEILEALAMLNDKNVLFVALGGNNKDIDFYKNKAKDLNLDKQSFFYPRVDQKELAIWQKIADILLMPFPDKAHYRYHMTPLKIFEYMTSNVPIIASSLPSIQEILNKNNAFFCEPGNILDLKNKIEFVLGLNKKERDKIAGQARKDVEQYLWSKRVEKIIKFLKK